MYTEIGNCRICGNQQFLKVISLGSQPQAGIFPKPGQAVDRGPLDLVKCDDSRADTCGLVQLKHSFPQSLLYGENYGYRSSLNQSMVNHLRRKAEYIRDFAHLGSGSIIVDIGSNDGTLLGCYPEDVGYRLIGIDPTIKKFGHFYKKNIEKFPDFFTGGLGEKILGPKKAQVITSISMFYDLDSPLDFVAAIKSSLADDGIWVFEQSYLPLMLERNSYDTICHEHLEYYHLKPIIWMLNQVGLKIADVELNAVNGGSISITAVHKESKHFSSQMPKPLAELLENENRKRLDTEAPYTAFRQGTEKHKVDLLAKLKSLKARGKKVFGYGASTKGNILLNYCDLSPALIQCIAEVNADKVGCVTPGSNIPIISEAEARRLNPDFFFVLPWHFRSFFMEKETEYLKKGGRFIFPLPEVEEVGL